jgi:hypothetical protein
MAKLKAKKPSPKQAKPAKKPAPKKQVAAPTDPALFAPLSVGERAGALRILLDDERLRELARVGRYRVIAVEPLVMKPPAPLAGKRLARAILFDYAGDRCVDACVDLDESSLASLSFTAAQPMLSPEEEQHARGIAAADPRLTPKDGAPLSVLHYWSKRAGDLAFQRRSAAVVFRSVVVVVDLMDGVVSDLVPTEVW